MSTTLRDYLRDNIKIKNASELYEIFSNKIQSNINVKPCLGSKTLCIAKVKTLLIIENPILNKLMDYGNLTPFLNKKLKNILSWTIQAIRENNTDKIMELIREVREQLKEGIIEFLIFTIIKKTSDLRPLNIPGSVGINEVPNLYYSTESYSEEEKAMLFMQLLEAIPITDSLFIKFHDDTLHNHIKRIIYSRYSSISDLSTELRLSKWERIYPYILLIRFISWIYEEVLKVEKDTLTQILQLLRDSSGIIYVIPKNRSENREEYRAEVFPQLTLFINTWMNNEINRKRLINMLNFFSSVAKGSYKKAKSKKMVSDRIKIMYNYLEIVARRMISYGDVSWESIRKALDIALELVLEYNLKANLTYIKSFYYV